MTIQFKPTELVTEPVRLAFPALFEAAPVTRGSDEKKFQAALLFPPDYDFAPLVAAIKAAIVEKWGADATIPRDKLPIRKCEDRANPPKGYDPGWRFTNVRSNYAPSVLGPQNQPILDPEKVYAGCWCRFHLNAYAWEHASGGRGVSFSLEAVRLERDDERLGGRRDAQEVFAEIEGPVGADDEFAAMSDAGDAAGDAGGDDLGDLLG